MEIFYLKVPVSRFNKYCATIGEKLSKSLKISQNTVFIGMLN